MMQLARDKERHRQAEIQRARMDQVQSPAPFCSEVIMPQSEHTLTPFALTVCTQG